MKNVFMKHAEKVTKNAAELDKHKEPESKKPILQGVKHYLDGSAVVIDSHRLYIAKDIHNREDGAVISPSTGKIIKGNFPEVSRLIPSSDPQYQESIGVNEWLKASDLMVTIAEASGELNPISLTKNIMHYDSLNIKAKFELPIEEIQIKLSCNAQYLLDALKMFKEFKYSDAELSLHGPMRPFTLVSSDKILTALIQPVRGI